MKNKHLISLLPLVFSVLYFLLSMDFPFWGDGIASVSKAAVRIYEEGFDKPWNYPDTDPGHGTLFPWTIALLWKVFGQHLWVAHMLVALCFFFLLRLLQTFVQLYEERLQLWAILLFALSPLSVSQAMEISLQLPLTLAFFAALLGLKKNRSFLFVFSMCCMVLIHVQGLLLLAVLGLYDIWRSWPLSGNWWKRFPLYFFPALVFLGWCYFHQREFGWALVTPNYPRARPDLSGALYNLGISAWRLLDLGYFVLLPTVIVVVKNLWNRRPNDLDRLFIPLAIILCLGIPVLFAYPPNHRYFLPVYLLLVPLFIRFVRKKKEKHQLVWLSAALVMLLSGNVWFYPGKCLGDQNLVFLGYHDLEKQMMAELPDSVVLHSYAPLNNASKFTWLEEQRKLSYADLYNRNLAGLDWVLESNLNCEFSEGDRMQLRTHFVARSYETYGVFVNVWMSKRLLPKYGNIGFSGPHRPGRAELFIQELRTRLKGS